MRFVVKNHWWSGRSRAKPFHILMYVPYSPRGRAAAVIIGVEAYEDSEHEKELLRILAKGDREIEAGKGYDLDTVLAEADAQLAKAP